MAFFSSLLTWQVFKTWMLPIIQSIVASWTYDVMNNCLSSQNEKTSITLDDSLHQAMCRAVERVVSGNDVAKAKYSSEEIRYYKKVLYDELIKLEPADRKKYVSKEIYEAFREEAKKSPNILNNITYSLIVECRKTQQESISVIADLVSITKGIDEKANQLVSGQQKIIDNQSVLKIDIEDVKQLIISGKTSTILEHILPTLKASISSLKVRTTLKFLESIKNEVEINAKDDLYLRAKIEYYCGLCQRFIENENCKSSFLNAYNLMKKANETDLDIIGAKIFLLISENDIDSAQELSLEIRRLDRNNKWAWIPELMTSKDSKELFKTIPQKLKEQDSILGELLLLNSNVPFQKELVDLNKSYDIPQYLDYENLSIWVLQLTIAINRLFKKLTFNVQAFESPDQTEVITQFSNISRNYLYFLKETEAINIIPDIEFIDIYCSFIKEKDISLLSLMNEHKPSNAFYEIYVLMKLNMMSRLELYKEAVEFINQLDILSCSIINMRLWISLKMMDVDNIVESYRIAIEKKIIFPPYQYGYFVSSLKFLIQDVYTYAKELRFESKYDESVFHIAAHHYYGDEINIQELQSLEQNVCPILYILIADIYKDLGNTQDALRLGKKAIVPGVVDFSSYVYVEILRKSGRGKELYHYLKEIRNSGYTENDNWLAEEANLAVAMSDYASAVEPLRVLYSRNPSNYSVFEKYLISLDRCGTNTEEINKLSEGIETTAIDPQYVPNIFNVLIRNNLTERAVGLLYHNILVSNNLKLRSLYFTASFNDRINRIILYQKNEVSDGDYVLLNQDGKERYETIHFGGRLEELIGKTVGDEYTLSMFDGDHLIRIMGIFTPYFKLYKEISEDAHNNRFKEFTSFTLDDLKGNDGDILGNLERIASTHSGMPKDVGRDNAEEYRSGKLTLGSFIREHELVGGMYEKLFGVFNIYVPQSIALSEYFKSTGFSSDSCRYVLDLSSLLMLCELYNTCNLSLNIKYIIPLGLKNLINESYLQEKLGNYSYISNSVFEKLYIPNPQQGETPLQTKIRQLQEWISKYCEVEIAEDKVNLTHNNVIRSSYMNSESESVLLALKSKYVLLTEDLGIFGMFSHAIRIMNIETWISLIDSTRIDTITKYQASLHYIGLQLSPDIIYEQYTSKDSKIRDELNSSIEYNPFIWSSVIDASFSLMETEGYGIDDCKQLLTMLFMQHPAENVTKMAKYAVNKFRNDYYTKCVLEALKGIYPFS